MDKLYKAYSIVPDLRTKKQVRVDWRSYSRVVGRVAGYLTYNEVVWLDEYLEKTYKIPLEFEELVPPFEDDRDYDEIELTPVQLLHDSEIDFAKHIFGYIVSFPLGNVGSVNEFLNLISESSDDQEDDIYE